MNTSSPVRRRRFPRWSPTVVTALLVVCVSVAACTGGMPTSSDRARGPLGGTLRLGMQNSPNAAMDPQAAYSLETWELFRCCLLRTLMSYAGAGGDDGTHPLPDLSAAPPQISADGLVWTFRLREGLKYAPPLETIEITAPDIVRALRRAGDAEAAAGGPSFYLSMIEGWDAYARGDSPTISGLATPDRYTLEVTETHPDGSLPYIFALPMTAPIPPLPGSARASFGVATGHEFAKRPVRSYGRYLVASGPYMFDGSRELDFSLPPDDQRPVSGYAPGAKSDAPTMVMIRNPSWDPSTDPLRAALADRIEIAFSEHVDALFERFAAGRLDIVYDAPPPISLLTRYQRSETLHRRIVAIDGNYVNLITFNVAVPPFDDVAVRRAVSYALDRAAMLRALRRTPGFGQLPVSVANHLSIDPTEDSLLGGWNPFPSSDGAADLGAARRSLARSAYARHGRCVARACAKVLVAVDGDPFGATIVIVARALHALGIDPTFTDGNFGHRCYPYGEVTNPRPHVGMCVAVNWADDFPDAGYMLSYFFHGNNFGVPPLLGASPDQLSGWGYSTTSVPSVDPELDRCTATLGASRPACWAEVDQLLMSGVVPAIPLYVSRPIRLLGPRITQFSWDQAYAEPALDRLAVVDETTNRG